MEYIPLALIAGVLTIFSPCVLPVAPVVFGGSIKDNNILKPLVIIGSLSTSLVLFALLLKASTLLIDIPQSFWASVSGLIILAFGLVTVFPEIWERLTIKLGFATGSQTLLSKVAGKEGFLGDVLIGAALGPVFSSCSPTYALVIATVLPESFIVGLINLIVYALGLAGMLLLLAVAGQKVTSRVGFLADPHSKANLLLGLVFVFLGIAIILGLDKRLEAYLIEQGWLGTTLIEQQILEDSNIGS